MDTQPSKKKKASNKKIDLEKTHQDAKSKYPLLQSAIQSDDTSFISEFLLQRDNQYQLKYLTQEDHEKLSILLLEFLDSPLRLLALNILKNLSCHKSVFETMRNRAVDFDKLVYLKGKIDYIKNKKVRSVSLDPECVLQDSD
ncbi:hypothetical protein P3W45_001777 [Vairimorpha bombi]|jgi:hypothetical protein